jgi:hypothetical protein
MGRAVAAQMLAELKNWLKDERAFGFSTSPDLVLKKIEELEHSRGRKCAACGRPACTKTGTPICCTLCAAGQEGHTPVCDRRMRGAVRPRTRPAERTNR